jgi:D-sedoheptulose 7-phosphate isomerase
LVSPPNGLALSTPRSLGKTEKPSSCRWKSALFAIAGSGYIPFSHLQTRNRRAVATLLTTRHVMSPTAHFLNDVTKVVSLLNESAIEGMVDLLVDVRKRGGRLFLLGVGGSAANASHAVNDFRKIAGIETYSPTDNVSELTARTNDEGWETVFVEYLRVSRLNSRDVVFVLSVGGGDLERNVSPNLVRALQYAKTVGASITGIVGRNGGYTARVADVCVIVPTVNDQNVTPIAEAFQGVVWHALVSHPALKVAATKWESMPNVKAA